MFFLMCFDLKEKKHRENSEGGNECVLQPQSTKKSHYTVMYLVQTVSRTENLEGTTRTTHHSQNIRITVESLESSLGCSVGTVR